MGNERPSLCPYELLIAEHSLLTVDSLFVSFFIRFLLSLLAGLLGCELRPMGGEGRGGLATLGGGSGEKRSIRFFLLRHEDNTGKVFVAEKGFN